MHLISKEISSMISACKNEKDIDKQVSMLLKLNKALPVEKRVAMQSLYTKNYVQRVLSWIEDSVLLLPKNTEKECKNRNQVLTDSQDVRLSP